jgi:nucleotide-binding universal stress UspA family protein
MTSIGAATNIALKSVLVAYDFSEASHKPLRHALAIARHYGARFYLAHAVSSLGYTIAGAEASGLAFERTQRDAQQLEQELLQSGALAGLHYEFILREGDVWEQLESVIKQKQVEMVVVGTHGRKNLGKLLLGSVAEQIFRHADCYVVTVGPGSEEDSLIERAGSVQPFLFATDFGPASVHALPHAISFANHFGAKLVVLHVLPTVPLPEGFHWSTTAGDIRQLRDHARLASLQRLDELLSQHPPAAIQPEFRVDFGMPTEKILHAAHAIKADAIIMGLHRSAHIDTASHMPWTTAYQVVCGAHCPVLTIRN